ncbi:hypothetical protein BGZ75_004144 [Mortierella antarctica]|nr:hypothetical protein BGZ75_004144 [Mortierella antarctica]
MGSIYRRKGFEDALVSIPPSRPHIKTVYDCFQYGLSVSPDGPCLGKRIYDPLTDTFGVYVWQTYTEVRRHHSLRQWVAQDPSGCARSRDGGPEWFVGVWAINRPEWTIASEACSAYNLISVGLYDTLGPEAVTYGVNHSLLRCSYKCESSKMPGLKAIISMDDLDSGKAGPGLATTRPVLRTYAQDKGLLLYDWSEIEALGNQHARMHTPPKSLDIYTICYTSGN